MLNPYPGLRPFEADEEHLFFGREKETDDLLRRLRSSRLLAVVGTSGSGKSSLVRSGLIPALQSGFMAGAGSSWRIATMRPGEDPIGHLAAALDTPAVLGGNPELGETNRVLLEVTLRRSSRGLIDVVRESRLPAGENVLVIVDQFEELFRFRLSRQIANSRDEAIAFVRLLLEAAEQKAGVYVVLTMRSDFIGDCMNFPGLPEAVNEGLYLVGRMSRDGLRAAISGPVAVVGGTIAPRLVTRVLNDLGDDHDQLPLVQHALMRTWDHWAATRAGDAPLDISDYEAIGTFRNALSLHAEEAYEETARAGHAEIAERIFKALTDTFTDARGVRRPTAVSELAAICETDDATVIEVIEIFRRPGRSFLMPPAAVPLGAVSIIDISHESLMRCWVRLIAWAEEERAAAAFYARLSQAAWWFEQGTAGLWRNPELELAERWRSENEPSAAWARRYDPGFDGAMAFLDRSIAEREREHAERQQERRAKLRRTQLVAAVLATLLVGSAVLGALAWMERQRAEANLALAREAVDESLAAADRDPSQIGADVPQVAELRRQLLAEAERFYVAFMNQEPRSDEARRDLAVAHLRLGHINRMLERSDDALLEYERAISMLTPLVDDSPAPENRQALATAYNWLGEIHRRRGRADEAADAYGHALRLQQALTSDFPAVAQYAEEYARTLSNRGILRSASPATVATGEADFREAIRILEPLTAESTRALQEMGRVANNLAAVLDGRGADEARRYYERAVGAHEELARRHPDNREYQLELATFDNNFAIYLHYRGDTAAAEARNRQAVELMTALARPAPSLAIERADAHNLRGVILREQNTREALRAFEAALDLFAEMQSAPAATRLPAFHVRFGDLLLNLAALNRDAGARATADQLLTRALEMYAGIARQSLASGTPDPQLVLDTLNAVVPELAERDRQRLSQIQEQLRGTLARRGPSQEAIR